MPFAPHPGAAQQQLDGAVIDDHAVAVDEVSAWNCDRRLVLLCTAVFGMHDRDRCVAGPLSGDRCAERGQKRGL